MAADEVKKPAEQSGSAAKEINRLMGQVHEESLKAVDTIAMGSHYVRDGVSAVNQVGKRFTDIIGIIDVLAHQISSLAA